MTLNEISYNLAEIAGQTDTPHFIERLKFNVLYYRALLIKRDQERNSSMPEQFMQSLCIDMQKVNASECCDVSLDCIIMRSATKLPKAIHVKSGSPFRYVGTIDNLKPFAPMSVGGLPYISYSTYTGKAPKYFIQNGYLYVINSKAQKLNVKGIFEDPRELLDFECSGDCYSDDGEFPITAEMVQRITQAMMAGELNATTNDGAEIKVND